MIAWMQSSSLAAEHRHGIDVLHCVNQPDLKEENSVRELHQKRLGIITVRDSETLLK